MSDRCRHSPESGYECDLPYTVEAHRAGHEHRVDEWRVVIWATVDERERMEAAPWVTS